MSPVIRPASLADKAALLAIEDTCFPTDRVSPRQMHYLLTRARSRIMVADNEGLLCAAVICLLPVLPRPARIYSLAVLPEQRGRGLAAALLQVALADIRQQAYRRCRLEVRESQQAVINLYRDFGFRPLAVLPAYYEDGEAALRMELDFDKPATD